MIDKYGIKVGQKRTPVGGSGHTVTIVDTTTYAYCDAVIIREGIALRRGAASNLLLWAAA